ncbi:hypothetical protein [Fischerella thermalis]|uniref:hypothetical protein n=1 Tax=Fischerella thermalis TaxID=372787 RepID=UPI00307D6D78
MEKGNVVIIAKVIGYEALGITEVWSVRSGGTREITTNLPLREATARLRVYVTGTAFLGAGLTEERQRAEGVPHKFAIRRANLWGPRRGQKFK